MCVGCEFHLGSTGTVVRQGVSDIYYAVARASEALNRTLFAKTFEKHRDQAFSTRDLVTHSRNPAIDSVFKFKKNFRNLRVHQEKAEGSCFSSKLSHKRPSNFSQKRPSKYFRDLPIRDRLARGARDGESTTGWQRLFEIPVEHHVCTGKLH